MASSVQIHRQTVHAVSVAALAIIDDYLTSIPRGLRSVYDEAERGETITAKLRLHQQRLYRLTRFKPWQLDQLLLLLDLGDGRLISRAQKVLIFLMVIMSGCSFRVASEYFQHSPSTIYMVFHEILLASLPLYQQFVKPAVRDDCLDI